MASANTNSQPLPCRKQFQSAASILRSQLSDPSQIIVCPGVYDGFTARIALSHGFQTLYMTGAGTSASRLGSPDLALVTLTEMHQNAAMIASLDSNVPVIADADTGFGGPLSVARTVKAYIDSNIAALHLEDQAVTKRCGHLAGKELVDIETYITRIRAAVMARAESGRDIVLIARTDALQSYGFDEAIRRLKAAVEAGADVAFLEGILDVEQAQRACHELAPTPCLYNAVPGGVSPILSAQEVQRLGFRIMIWPIIALTEVFNSVGRAMKELKETGFHTSECEVKDDKKRVKGGVREIFEICGLEECAAFDEKAGGKAYSKGV